MGQPLSGPLLVLGAAEKNCLEKLEQTVTRSGPEDTHTHTLQFTAHWPDLVSQAVKKVNHVVCQKAERQHTERKHNDYQSIII